MVCGTLSILFLLFVLLNANYAKIGGTTIEPPPTTDSDRCPVKELKGEKGDTGPAGPAGKDGLPGPKGDKGDLGQTGQKGEMGIAGSRGSKGCKGIPGDDGKTGAAGSKGEKGEEGKCDSQCGQIKKLQTELKTLKANYTAEVTAIKKKLAYLMIWVHPLGSKENPAVSCRQIKERHKDSPSGPYFIKVKDTNLPGGVQEVYCIMTRTWNCPAGLTQVLKVDGRKTTFRYSSPLWTNKQMYLPENGKTGCDQDETKLATYWSTPFESICLRMGPPNAWWAVKSLKIDVKANSLYDLIAPGKCTTTNLSVKDWKNLLRGSSLQTNCLLQGINVHTSLSSARIGILGNEQNHCNSPDSYIGVGTAGSSCGRNPRTSCGNEAGCGADGGDQHIQSMGYIYVY